MYSVTQRIQNIKQPYGGYLPFKEMLKVEYGGELLTKDDETTSPSCIGSVVDYLSRYKLNKDFEKAFHISLLGLEEYYVNIKHNEKLFKTYRKRFWKINHSLDDNSIKLACELVGYDCYCRSPYLGEPSLNIPNDETIKHIRGMVNRTLNFINSCNGEMISENTFFKQYKGLEMLRKGKELVNGYTRVITSGDFDMCIGERMIDFKTSKDIKAKDTLQVLIYGLMYNHMYPSTIKEVGIFNPRTNTYYYKRLSDIKEDYLEEIKSEVIGYRYPLDESSINAYLISRMCAKCESTVDFDINFISNWHERPKKEPKPKREPKPKKEPKSKKEPKAKTITKREQVRNERLNHLMENKKDDTDLIKIIAYRSSMDIDIQYLSTGEVKTHLRYDHICRKYTLIGVDEK